MKRTAVICPREGSIFECRAQALVNPVNCVGVAGAGLAKEFKEKFPENQKQYMKGCKDESLVPGAISMSNTGKKQPEYIVNFPTKKHWKETSQFEYIERGLKSLVTWVNLEGVKSIAVPALGCGLGALSWGDVRPLIMRAAIKMNRVKVYLYAPQGENNNALPDLPGIY